MNRSVILWRRLARLPGPCASAQVDRRYVQSNQSDVSFLIYLMVHFLNLAESASHNDLWRLYSKQDV